LLKPEVKSQDTQATQGISSAVAPTGGELLSGPTPPATQEAQPATPVVGVAKPKVHAHSQAKPKSHGPQIPDTTWMRPLPMEREFLPALYAAVLNEDIEAATDWLTHGAWVDEPTPGGDTAFCAAIRQGVDPLVRAMIFCGADLTQVGVEGQPPVALAALDRKTPVLKTLLGAGADPDTRVATPVHQRFIDAAGLRDLKSSFVNDAGLTPLMLCAIRGDVDTAVLLLRAGASTDKHTTLNRRYPINFACTQGYLFLMRVLLGRDPDSEPAMRVTVDLSLQRAYVKKHGVVIDSCSVSSGRKGFDTPPGQYVITNKYRSWTSTLYHVEMPFFMRLNCSAIGLHAGYVTGRPASHGCVRLPPSKAKKFFELLGVGDEVEIVP